MTNDIIILGSTGSIGRSTLSSIKKNKKFKVKLISTKKNIKKILQQAIYYKVKDVIIEDKKEFNKYQYIFKKKKIKLHLGLGKINTIIKKKSTFLCECHFRLGWSRTYTKINTIFKKYINS